ncbi:MAG: hypothetical protein AAFP76_12185 [Bacteroidota bacterium]
MQEVFIRSIRALLPENRSIIDEVSGILNLSYDAAYRRVNCKTALSLEEAVQLAKHFKLSLNNLFEVGNQGTLLAEKSPIIENVQGLEMYFKAGLQNIKPLISIKNASITYSAKDIPIFYTLSDSYITRYKCYVWLKFLNEDGSMAKVSFEDFLQTMPPSLIKAANDVSEAYQNINIIEFWNDNTINGTLQQIFYYFETKLLSKEMALNVCQDIKNIISHVEQQTINQTILNSKNDSSYQLYKSDLLTMSNTVMVKARGQKMFLTPFTVLSYFKIQHPETCDQMDRFFEKQMKNSKLLVNAGEKDRSQFFNKMQKKVDTVIDRLNMDQDLTFF